MEGEVGKTRLAEYKAIRNRRFFLKKISGTTKHLDNWKQYVTKQ
jgi:hypothetical protein